MNTVMVTMMLTFAAMVQAAAVSVTDDTGHTVTLAEPASRIVTLAPHTTELVFAAGAGDRLIAVASYSDFPPAAAELPRIGGSGGVDRERLLQLRPDLVIAWHSGSGRNDLIWLKSRGIPMFQSEPRSLGHIPHTLRKLGTLAGTSEYARMAAEQFERDLVAVCRVNSPTRRAYYQLWDSPALTYGGRHWANDALTRVGLTNVFVEVDRRVFSPTKEAVLTKAPDAVLAPELTNVDPQIADRVIRVPDAWDRPTPRILSALRGLCSAASALSR